MNVSTIIAKVRAKIDDATTTSDIEDRATDDIIKSCIPDALRWCLLYAPSESLLVGTTTGTSTASSTTNTNDEDIIVSKDMDLLTESNSDVYYVKLPQNTLRILRIRMATWHRAISRPIEESSEEYLELNDDTARATNDRPQAAIIRTNPTRIEVYPGVANGKVSLTYAVMPDLSNTGASDSDDVKVPINVQTSFIYYLCYLLLTAWNETNHAAAMFEVAKMNLGNVGQAKE